MDNISIRERLISLPLEIRDKQIEVASIIVTLEEKRSRSKTIEIIIAGKVTSNKLLTNDIMRKAAILDEITNDATYQGLLTDTTILEGQFKAKQIGIDYLQNLFRAFITVAGMKGVE